MFWRLVTDCLLPDRALRVSNPDEPVSVVVRPEIVEATELVPVGQERDERTWWPGLGIVVHDREPLIDFLRRIEGECDAAATHDE